MGDEGWGDGEMKIEIGHGVGRKARSKDPSRGWGYRLYIVQC